jgi:hypothetical protein
MPKCNCIDAHKNHSRNLYKAVRFVDISYTYVCENRTNCRKQGKNLFKAVIKYEFYCTHINETRYC